MFQEIIYLLTKVVLQNGKEQENEVACSSNGGNNKKEKEITVSS